MSSDGGWLDAAWQAIRDRLPPTPARVVEIGCGELGGFVPRLRAAGYDAIGVDPDAPAEPDYRCDEFEAVELDAGIDLVVASTSLHHVADPAQVLDRTAALLRPGGTIVVIEWAWERFDEQAARWCFDRLGDQDDPDDWLHRHRERWIDSGRPWSAYLAGWAAEHRIHRGDVLLAALDERFRRTYYDEHLAYGFSSLPGVTAADELDAVRRGELRPSAFVYVGVR